MPPPSRWRCVAAQGAVAHRQRSADDNSRCSDAAAMLAAELPLRVLFAIVAVALPPAVVVDAAALPPEAELPLKVLLVTVSVALPTRPLL